MLANIRDVAGLAGVSTATVSRVLADSPRVLPDTRKKVLSAIKELDYRPSAIARSLRMSSTAVFGLIVTDIVNPFYPEVVRGIEDEAESQHRAVLLCNAARNAEREEGYLDILLERRVDAVIIASSGLARRQSERLANYSIPIVLLNVSTPSEHIPAVTSDDRSGGKLAAEHLIERDYRNLVYLGASCEPDVRPERLQGVYDVVDPSDLLVVDCDASLEGGADAMREIAKRVQPPFGVVAHNDLIAIGAMSVLQQIGWEVPDQVGVVGFDDITLSRFVTPSLTTLAQDKYGMGVIAAQTADRLVAGEPVRGTSMLPINLVVRESTNKDAS